MYILTYLIIGHLTWTYVAKVAKHRVSEQPVFTYYVCTLLWPIVLYWTIQGLVIALYVNHQLKQQDK